MEDRKGAIAVDLESQLFLKRHTETVLKFQARDKRIEPRCESLAEANPLEAGNKPPPDDTQPVHESHKNINETRNQFLCRDRPPDGTQQYQPHLSFFSRLLSFILPKTAHGGAQASPETDKNERKRKAAETGNQPGNSAANASNAYGTPVKQRRLSRRAAVTGTPPGHRGAADSLEVYYPNDLAKLGSCQEPWSLGSTEAKMGAHRARCHQCGREVGRHSACSWCHGSEGRVCGDCLYTRYGENLNEVERNPQWVCPACRGICNCLFCRSGRGWPCLTPSYHAVKAKGFPSVAHYLITTKQACAMDAADGPVGVDGSMDNAPCATDLAPRAHLPSPGGHLAAGPRIHGIAAQSGTPAHAALASGTADDAVGAMPPPFMGMNANAAAPSDVVGVRRMAVRVGPTPATPNESPAATISPTEAALPSSGPVALVANATGPAPTADTTSLTIGTPGIAPSGAPAPVATACGPMTPLAPRTAPPTPATIMPDPMAHVEPAAPAVNLASPVRCASVPMSLAAPFHCPSSSHGTRDAEMPSVPRACTSAPEELQKEGSRGGAPEGIENEPEHPSPAAKAQMDLGERPCAPEPEPLLEEVFGVVAPGVAGRNVEMPKTAGHETPEQDLAADGGNPSKVTEAGSQHGAQQGPSSSEEMQRGTPMLGSPVQTESKTNGVQNMCSQPRAIPEAWQGPCMPAERGADLTGIDHRGTVLGDIGSGTPQGHHDPESQARHDTAADPGDSGRKRTRSRSEVMEISRVRCTYLRVETVKVSETASPTKLPQTASGKRARALDDDFRAAGAGVGERKASYWKGEASGARQMGGQVRQRLSEAARLLQTNLRSGRLEESKGVGPAVEDPGRSREEESPPEQENEAANLRLASHKCSPSKGGPRSAGKGRDVEAPHASGMLPPSHTRPQDAMGQKGERRRAVKAGRVVGARRTEQGRRWTSASEVAKLLPRLLRMELVEAPPCLLPTARVTRSMCTGARHARSGQRHHETDLQQDADSHELRDTAAWGVGHGHGGKEEGVGQTGGAMETGRQSRDRQVAKGAFSAPKNTMKGEQRVVPKELARLAPTLLRVSTLEGTGNGGPAVQLSRRRGSSARHTVTNDGTGWLNRDSKRGGKGKNGDEGRTKGRTGNEMLSDCGSKAEHNGSTAGKGQGEGQGSPGNDEYWTAAEQHSICQD